MRKRLVYRADDIGYSKTFNDGAFKAIEEGIVTSADVMLDTPGAVDALTRLRDYPWISFGWHSGHLWGSPVAPVEKVPHMVDESGHFFWYHETRQQESVPYDEAYIEFDAEIQLAIDVFGRAPDTTDVMFDRPIDKAKRDICKKYGIKYNFCRGNNPGGMSIPVDPEYEGLKYSVFVDPQAAPRKAWDRKAPFALDQYHLYDPIAKIKRITWTDDEIWRSGGHPGFLDDLILRESSCNIHRVKDVIAITSQELKNWIIEEGVELVNQRDVLYGTSEFQDHLRIINSPLWIGNRKSRN